MAGEMFADVGRTLRALRESKGLSQAELARRSGLGKSQISRYEREKELPRFESLEKLLCVLGADPLTLFYTAHLLKHRAEISPIGIMVTASPILDDPAMETFRSVFGHLLKAFEIMIATRILKDLQKD